MTIAFAQYNLNLVSVLPSLNQNKIEDCALGVLCLVYSSIAYVQLEGLSNILWIAHFKPRLLVICCIES
jgi:hypothetical protein